MDYLYSYKNGNYHVTLGHDGTKIRETYDPDATEFLPEFPEQMDCKITNNCDMGHGVGGLNICSYCHEASHTQGKHGDLQNTLKILDCLPPGIELACLHGDTVIFTEHGPKKIQDVSIGEKVYNEKGGLSKIVGVQSNVKKTIKLKGNKGVEFVATPDHLFLSEGELVPARDLLGRNLDIAQFTGQYCPPIDLSRFVKARNKNLPGSRGGKTLKDEVMLGHNSRSIPRFLEVNEDVMWLYGLHVAQGDSRCLTINIKEMDIALRAQNIFYNITGLQLKIIEKPESNAIVLESPSKIVFSTIFQKAFRIGSGAKNKSIEFLFGLEKELVASALFGMFQGDGCFRKRKTKTGFGYGLSYKTASEKIANQLHYLLSVYFGVASSYYLGRNKKRKIEGRILNPSKYYKIDIYGRLNIDALFPGYFDQDDYYVQMGQSKYSCIANQNFKVSAINEGPEEAVFDIFLENSSSHLFTLAGGIITHNCGGGNPLVHPDLLPFFQELRKIGIVPNLTVNELHLVPKYLKMIDRMIVEQLAFGFGVSYRSVNKDHSGLYRMMDYPHAVIHLIAGIDDVDDIRGLMKKIKTKKFLLLGFKDFRKGSAFKRKFPEVVERNLRKWYNQLPVFVNEVVDAGGVVSFDNLGIEQLGVRRLMNDAEWNTFYQGDEGTSSFYLDAVKEEFALNSMHPVRYKYLDNVVEMFRHIRNENY